MVVARYERLLKEGFATISAALAEQHIDQIFVDTKFEFGCVGPPLLSLPRILPSNSAPCRVVVLIAAKNWRGWLKAHKNRLAHTSVLVRG